MEKKHLIHGNIAGFTYYEGAEVFEQLKIGTELRLEREDDNKFDPYAVAIYFKDKKLGFIPRGENCEINKLLEMGYESIFDIRVNKIACEKNTEEQIGFVIHIKKKKKEKSK